MSNLSTATPRTSNTKRRAKRRITRKLTPLCPKCRQPTYSRKVEEHVRTCYCLNKKCAWKKGIKQARD